MNILLTLVKILAFLLGLALIVGGGLGGFCGLLVHENAVLMMGLLAALSGVGLIAWATHTRKEALPPEQPPADPDQPS